MEYTEELGELKINWGNNAIGTEEVAKKKKNVINRLQMVGVETGYINTINTNPFVSKNADRNNVGLTLYLLTWRIR